jgi:hypothetical protein
MKFFIFKHKHMLGLFAILTAFTFDLLFWEKPWGINFFIFILLALFGGLVPFWLSKIAIPWTSYLLLIPVVTFGVFTFIRAEPMTTLMNSLLTIGALVLFTLTLRNGKWAQDDFPEHILNLFKFLLNAVIGGLLFFLSIKTEEDEPESAHEPAESTGAQQGRDKEKAGWAYLRGVLLALPIVFILALLLASADPVFGSRLRGLLSWYNFENLGEVLFRISYTLVIAYLLLGCYFFGLVKSGERNSKPQSDPDKGKILGTIETGVVFGAMNLLFLGFVLIQFTYLFGGDQNISIEGYTYAEYARRGFFELAAVAVLSSGLFSVLSRISRRKNKAQKWTITGLGLLLLALVGIILVSAYTRLTLYEAAYGFTRLRTFTHVFIFWTGGMLAALAALEITQSMKRLAFILILMLMFFGLAINILNVDGFIVRQNIRRGIEQHQENSEAQLDTAYLSELSFDALPPLIAYYQHDTLPQDLRQAVGGVLACRLETLDIQEQTPITSWHFSRSQATSQLQGLEGTLSGYRVFQSEDPWGWFAEIGQETFPCNLPWD